MSNIARQDAPPPHGTTSIDVHGDKYTVLLLDEAQLERFLNRSRSRPVTSLPARTVDIWPRAHRYKTWAVAAGMVCVAATAAVWLRAAGDADPSAAAARHMQRGMPLATGASFSVEVASFARDTDARAMATRLTRRGLAAFAWRLDGAQRQVLVGPFVSIDEAEAARRAVARQGYSRPRLHVDERLRTADAPRSGAAGPARQYPGVVLVAAPGRLAVAFELSRDVQRVSGQRVDATTFEIIASATGPAIDAQEWSAPSDAQLVKHVSVVSDPLGTHGLTARVTVAENARASVRLEGSRIYVDVSRAQLDFDDRLAAGAGQNARAVSGTSTSRAASSSARGSSTGGRAGDAASAPAEVEEYRNAIASVFARFEEIQPFLRSSVASPTPEVLAAIAGTFTELEQTLRSTTVPPSAVSVHGLMLSAVQLAKAAVAPSVYGDRVTQVREAIAQFHAAKAQLK